MATKDVLRYRLDATIEGDIEYDTAEPGSYTTALLAVDAKRKALKDLGATITKDSAKPVAVREKAEPEPQPQRKHG